MPKQIANQYWKQIFNSNRVVEINGIPFRVDSIGRTVLRRRRHGLRERKEITKSSRKGRRKVMVKRNGKLVEYRVGAPARELDWDRIKKYCRVGCSTEQIAQILGLSRQILERNDRFRTIYSKHTARDCFNLSRRQYDLAMTGHAGMLIWLGKQYLGQKDQVVQENTGTMQHNVAVRPDLSKLSIEELEQFRELLVKAKGKVIDITPGNRQLAAG